MKRQLLNSLAIGALLSTGTAVAQTPSPSASPPMAAPTPAATATSPTPAPGSSANQFALPSKTETASAAFGKLSAKHPGYVSSEDVSKLQGFDFKGADKNNDGKLDQAEFNAAWTAYTGTK
jgi:hypothetical protein